jgi:hypothetical protein
MSNNELRMIGVSCRGEPLGRPYIHNRELMLNRISNIQQGIFKVDVRVWSNNATLLQQGGKRDHWNCQPFQQLQLILNVYFQIRLPQRGNI